MSKTTSTKKRKTKKQFAERKRASHVAEPKMSEVIAKVAQPLLQKYGGDPERAQAILALAIVAWNKSLLPNAKQDDIEKDIINSFVPPEGDAELIGSTVYMMELIDQRRKELFPDLRKLIVDYDMSVCEGKIAFNVASTTIPAGD